VVSFVSLGSSYTIARARKPTPPPRPKVTTDSVWLDQAGYGTGPHLLAYVLVSANCSVCARDEVKSSVAQIRGRLRAKYGLRFKRIAVIGVAVDKDLKGGLGYLSGLGLDRFDEVDIGGGWLNEQFTDRIWRAGVSEALVPQVILATRWVESRGDPSMRLDVRPDTVLRVVKGGSEIVQWIKRGTPLEYQARVDTAESR